MVRSPPRVPQQTSAGAVLLHSRDKGRRSGQVVTQQIAALWPGSISADDLELGQKRYAGTPRAVLKRDLFTCRRLAIEGAAAVLAMDSAAVEGIEGQLADLAKQVGRSPGVLLAEFTEAMWERRVARWAEEIGLAPTSLPVERPDLHADDPSVDEVVRLLLHQIAERLRDYPLPKWARLVDVLVSVVKFVHYVRDRMPRYVLCAEYGGVGRAASERDLQDGPFEWLRQAFGRTAVYELARSGGGRPDNGVVFPEARFPVEAKHEFHSVAPEHVRRSFVAQSDVYATAADRVSFLTILDLRAANAAGHRDRLRTKRRAGENR